MGLGSRKSSSSGLDMKTHLYFGFLARLLLTMYGAYHDRSFALKYTDVDYHVLTDGAREMATGGSPFDRHTYRYTPLLALLLLPNVKCHFLCGKIIFALLDCGAARLISAVATADGQTRRTATTVALLWLYNPVVMAVSSRGSADAVVAALTLALLLAARRRLPVIAGALLGVAVHVKLYPVIYALPIYASLTPRAEAASLLYKLFPSWTKFRFAASAAAAFVLLTGTSLLLYGEQYLEESFLYHARRADARHNFSVYFYSLYLCGERLAATLATAAFVPQATVTAAFGLAYGAPRHLPFAFFAQTVTFVSFNKVVTSQYFVWALALLPTAAPRLALSWRKAASLSALWVAAQGAWLLPAYLLEFRALNAFLSIWLESVAFFCCNVGILMACVAAYSQSYNAIPAAAAAATSGRQNTKKNR